jgi:hypothetical protein
VVDFTRLARGLAYERQWGIVVLGQTLDELLAGAAPRGPLLAAPERDRFWADPFPLRGESGDLWVFAEEMHRWRGLGCIVALLIDAGKVVRRQVVRMSGHHYSFPQVHDATTTDIGFRWLATVETCDPQAYLYGFNEPGEPWVSLDRSIPVGVVDPALSLPTDPAEGAWYLTGTRGADAFAAFRQWRAVNGRDWQEQPAMRFHDPVVARPAGNADRVRALRSAQDCSDNYGVASSLLAWDPHTRGPGVVQRRLSGDDFEMPAAGTHTLSWTPDGQTVVADVWRRRLQPLSAAHRYLEARHPRTCPGRATSLTIG